MEGGEVGVEGGVEGGERSSCPSFGLEQKQAYCCGCLGRYVLLLLFVVDASMAAVEEVMCG